MPRRHDVVPVKRRVTDPRPNPATTSPLQLAAANRARLVLSLLDQRADGGPGFWLSHPVMIEGLNPYLPMPLSANYSTASRLLRGHRGLTFDFCVALSRWAESAFGLVVDPGWIAFGHESAAAPPEIPADLVLRPDTDLDGLVRSHRTWREIRADERRRRRVAG